MINRIAACLGALCLVACASAKQDLPGPSLEKIAEGVWIHKSYEHVEPWGAVLSQGMVVKTEDGVFLIDTAWDEEDDSRTELLLTLIEEEMGEAPIFAILTHGHADKMGGVGALKAAGIRSAAHVFANADAPARGLTPAEEDMFADGTIERFGPNDEITVYYPGAGHTRGNIVVYYAPARILFGGCLIKPGGSKSLGNTADGDIGHWAQAVRNVAMAFPDADTVIPSHGPAGGPELFAHTIALAEAAND